MEQEFSTVIKNSSITTKTIQVIIGLGVLGLFISLIIPEKPILTPFLFFTGFFSTIIAFSNPWTNLIKEYKKVGVLKLTSDYIEIENEKLPLSSIKELKIELKSYSGHSNGRNPFLDNGFQNTIHYINHEEQKQVQFHITSSKRFYKIAEILESWYHKNINFTEETLGQKSYLMKSNLSYQEIQEFKQRYQLS